MMDIDKKKLKEQEIRTLFITPAENGILDFERVNILEIPPFNLIGKPTKIIKLFGAPAGFEQAIKELEEEIYKIA